MTDYTKLSDSELNEIVAKVLGWESYNGDSWKQRRISGCYLYDALPNYLDPANLHRLMDDARAAGYAFVLNDNTEQVVASVQHQDGPGSWSDWHDHPTSANRALAEAIAQLTGDRK